MTPCIICLRPTGHPDRLCPFCLPWVEHIRSASVHQHQSAAIEFAIHHAGDHVQANGSDLAQWDDDQVRGFVKEIVDAYGAGLRAEIAKNEVPF